jgi:predicted oxidoreductase
MLSTTQLGQSGPVTTRLIYGCMRVVHTWDPAEVDADRRARGVASIQAAYELGFRHFDNADIYCRGVCEEVLGEAIRQTAGMREAICLTTKCGIRFENDPPGSPKRFDFSAGHIKTSCERSLERLGVEAIDLFLLHRPDALMDPQEVAEAFEDLLDAGKVLHVGVSNFSIPQLDALQAACSQELVCNQIELHPGRLGPIEDGELWQLQERGVTPTAWSPLWRGTFASGGQPPADHPQADRMRATNQVMDEVAERLGSNRTAVALAWLMRHASNIGPIVGSTDADHLRDAVAADKLDLSRDDWYRIYTAARGKQVP